MSLRLAVLAMLDIGSASGYALSRRFSNSIGFFWNVSHQQLYKELHALHAAHLLDVEEIQQSGKPNKKIYSINPLGKQELMCLLSKSSSDVKVKVPILVKLYSGKNLSLQEIEHELDQHLEKHSQLLQTYYGLHMAYEALPSDQQARFFYPMQTLKCGIKLEEALIEWAKNCKIEVREKHQNTANQ